MPSSVTPYSLVLQRSVCAYCNKDLPQQLASLVWWNFGIIHCPEHQDSAKVDICAFMHKHKYVAMRDALRNPVLAPLFEILQRGVSVVRSNGQLQPGWTLLVDMFSPTCRLEGANGQWFCKFVREEDDIQKTVPLNSLFTQDGSPSEKNILIDAIAALDAGIYKDTAMRQVQDPESPTETLNVVSLMVDGRPCRVFVPITV